MQKILTSEIGIALLIFNKLSNISKFQIVITWKVFTLERSNFELFIIISKALTILQKTYMHSCNIILYFCSQILIFYIYISTNSNMTRTVDLAKHMMAMAYGYVVCANQQPKSKYVNDQRSTRFPQRGKVSLYKTKKNVVAIIQYDMNVNN